MHKISNISVLIIGFLYFKIVLPGQPIWIGNWVKLSYMLLIFFGKPLNVISLFCFNGFLQLLTVHG